MLTAYPSTGLALLIGAQVILLVLLRELRHRRGLHPEVSRKITHIALGLSMAACPYLFDEAWPVFVLAGSAVFVIAVMRWLPAIKQRFGGVVGGVARGTGGDFYFPVAAAVLFGIADGDRILYGVPILTLTFADATAALIGVFYGRNHLTGADKTVEGSLAFFLAAFFSTHVPLLLQSSATRGESLVIAVIFGLIVMLLEAVSLYGTDNVIIPLGGYLLLRAFLGMSAPRLSVLLGVVLLMGALVLTLRRRRSLDDAAMLAAVLVGFLVWSVGGWRWVVPPLVFFLAYVPLWPSRRVLRHKSHGVRAIMAVTSAGLLWLALAVVLKTQAFYYVYTLAFAAHLTFIGIDWQHGMRRKLTPFVTVGRSIVVAWLAMFIPYAIVMWGAHDARALAWFAPAWLAVGGVAYVLLVQAKQTPHIEQPWTRQALIGVGASALGLLQVVPAVRAALLAP